MGTDSICMMLRRKVLLCRIPPSFSCRRIRRCALRGTKRGESPHARLSFIRRSLTRALPLKITDAGRAGTERREIKKEYEKRL